MLAYRLAREAMALRWQVLAYLSARAGAALLSQQVMWPSALEVMSRQQGACLLALGAVASREPARAYPLARAAAE